MKTFGEIVIHILQTIIKNTLHTMKVIGIDIVLLLKTIYLNLGYVSPLTLIFGVLILFVILYGIYRFFKGEVKIIIIGLILLLILILIGLL